MKNIEGKEADDGNLAIVKTLINADAGINKKADDTGELPLMIAAEKGEERTSALLLRSWSEKGIESFKSIVPDAWIKPN